MTKTCWSQQWAKDLLKRFPQVELSQNIIGSCAFDIYFLYMLAGWEKSAHHAEVPCDAFSKSFIVATGTCFLRDTGSLLSKEVYTLYRCVSYYPNVKKQAQER